ncbi:hypothetical protein THRCLA_01338 [Thraustotheca clavata]|uniref:Uncharacterized protein n=1 Tax=Thraustotheca clavata TaxID=74557 RepID=A0A1W0A8J1_9STRA|nr:hypothetical protein THRCLA_01338 [Thraustotheca clavata]
MKIRGFESHGHELLFLRDKDDNEGEFSVAECSETVQGRWCTAVAASAMEKAVHFEILESCQGIVVGVVNGAMREGTGVGRTGNSYGLNALGEFLHCGKSVPSQLSFETYDSISIVLDLDEEGPAGRGTLTFYRHRPGRNSVIVLAFSGVYQRSDTAFIPVVQFQYPKERVRLLWDYDAALQPPHELHAIPEAMVGAADIISFTKLKSLKALWNASRGAPLDSNVLSLIIAQLPNLTHENIEIVLAIMCNIVTRASTPVVPPSAVQTLYDLIDLLPDSNTLPWILVQLVDQTPSDTNLQPLLTVLNHTNDLYAQQGYIAILLHSQIHTIPLPTLSLNSPLLEAAWAWIAHDVERESSRENTCVQVLQNNLRLKSFMFDTMKQIPQSNLNSSRTDAMNHVLATLIKTDLAPSDRKEMHPDFAVKHWVDLHNSFQSIQRRRSYSSDYLSSLSVIRQILLHHRLLVQEVVTERRQWSLPPDDLTFNFAELPIVQRLLYSLYSSPQMLALVLSHSGYLNQLPINQIKNMANFIVCSLWSSASGNQHLHTIRIAHFLNEIQMTYVLGTEVARAFARSRYKGQCFWRKQMQATVNWLIHDGSAVHDKIVLEFISCELALQLLRSIQELTCSTDIIYLLAALKTEESMIELCVIWVSCMLQVPEWLLPNHVTPERAQSVLTKFKHIISEDYLRHALKNINLENAIRQIEMPTDSIEDPPTICFSLYGFEILQILQAAAISFGRINFDTDLYKDLESTFLQPTLSSQSIEGIVTQNPFVMTVVMSQALPSSSSIESKYIPLAEKVVELFHAPLISQKLPLLNSLNGLKPLQEMWLNLSPLTLELSLQKLLFEIIDLSQAFPDISIQEFLGILNAILAFQESQVVYFEKFITYATCLKATIEEENRFWTEYLENSRQHRFAARDSVIEFVTDAKAKLKSFEVAPCQCRLTLNKYHECETCTAKLKLIKECIDLHWLGVQLELSHTMNNSVRELYTLHQQSIQYFVSPKQSSSSEAIPQSIRDPFSLLPLAFSNVYIANGWNDHIIVERLHSTEWPKWRKWLYQALYAHVRMILFPSLLQDSVFYDQLVLLELLLPSDLHLDQISSIAFWTQKLILAMEQSLVPTQAQEQLQVFVAVCPQSLMTACVVKARPRWLFSVLRTCYVWAQLLSPTPLEFAAFVATEGWHDLLITGLLTFQEKDGDWAVYTHERLQRNLVPRYFLDKALRHIPSERLQRFLSASAQFQEQFTLHENSAIVVQSSPLDAQVPAHELVLHCGCDPDLVNGILTDLSTLSSSDLVRLLNLTHDMNPQLQFGFLWSLAKAVLQELQQREDIPIQLRCMLRHLYCIQQLGFSSGYDTSGGDINDLLAFAM